MSSSSVEVEGIVYQIEGDNVSIQREDCSYYSCSKWCFALGSKVKIGDKVRVVFIPAQGTKAFIVDDF